MEQITVPMPSAFVANILAADVSEDISTNAEACAHLMERVQRDLNGRSLSEPSYENNLTIGRMMAAETLWHLTRNDQPTSLNWYTRSIDNMVAVSALLHPELNDDDAAASHPSGLFRCARDAQTVYFAAMAITSQNNKVNENMRYALEQYRAFLSDGKFNPSRSYGAKANAISHNLARFNLICERANQDLGRVSRLLSMKVRMGDIRKVAQRYGITLSSAELEDEMVYGSILFGPKVGNGFYQNLIGNYNPVTIDLWFMRTWGRYTGTLVRGEIVDGVLDKLIKSLRKSMRNPNLLAIMEKTGVAVDPDILKTMSADELFNHVRKLGRTWEIARRAYVKGKIKDDFSPKKRLVPRTNSDASALKQNLVWPLACESIMDSLGSPVDAPRSASQRKWIREVVSIAQGILEKQGFRISAADLQATLWYPEKEIYGKLTGRNAEQMNVSFDEAIIKIAKAEGIDDEAITRAVCADDFGRSTGREVSGRTQHVLAREPIRIHR